MTRICPRCGTVNSLVLECGAVVCIACGHRPNGEDPGAGPEAAYQLGLAAMPGAEKHSKGVIGS
jgi:hypothetical protein